MLVNTDKWWTHAGYNESASSLELKRTDSGELFDATEVERRTKKGLKVVINEPTGKELIVTPYSTLQPAMRS